MDGNRVGVYAYSNNPTTAVKVSIRDSRAIRNTQFGLLAQTAGGTATLSARNNIISNNHIGIAASNPSSKVWASGNTVSNNSTGLSNTAGAIFESAGNNAVRNNDINAFTGIATVPTM